MKTNSHKLSTDFQVCVVACFLPSLPNTNKLISMRKKSTRNLVSISYFPHLSLKYAGRFKRHTEVMCSCVGNSSRFFFFLFSFIGYILYLQFISLFHLVSYRNSYVSRPTIPPVIETIFQTFPACQKFLWLYTLLPVKQEEIHQWNSMHSYSLYAPVLCLVPGIRKGIFIWTHSPSRRGRYDSRCMRQLVTLGLKLGNRIRRTGVLC